jgi:hypothetical protein
MSAPFAIPATTFVLRKIIEARLANAYTGFAVPPVSIEPPPRLPPPGPGAAAEKPGLVLYLHHAVPNGAWRNMYEPHVDAAGQRVAPAPLVLDLHYLLGALGADLEREALLGIAMSAFHRNGIVPRPMIHAILTPNAPGNATFMVALPGEPLDDEANQPESITITQQPLDVDMSTKIWGALQSPMRPCAYYLVTTVFLDTGEKYPAVPEVLKLRVGGRPDPDSSADKALFEVLER